MFQFNTIQSLLLSQCHCCVTGHKRQACRVPTSVASPTATRCRARCFSHVSVSQSRCFASGTLPNGTRQSIHTLPGDLVSRPPMVTSAKRRSQLPTLSCANLLYSRLGARVLGLRCHFAHLAARHPALTPIPLYQLLQPSRRCPWKLMAASGGLRRISRFGMSRLYAVHSAANGG